MSFPKQILITLVVVAVLAAYPLVAYGNREIIEAAVAGALLTTVNVFLGYAAIEFAFEKSVTTFFKFVLGGMAVRMFVMAGILVVLIKVFLFDARALVASLGVLYLVFLTLEVLYIQKRVQRKQNSSQ